MRPLELVLAGFCASAVAWPALLGVRSKRGVVFGVAVVTIAAQLVAEGWRWQMVPLYLVAAGVGLGDLFSMERNLPWWRRVSRPSLGLIGVGMMAILPAALPVPALPQPSGSLAVGTMTIEIRFPDRLEHYGPVPDTAKRRIMVEVWYPAQPSEASESGPWTADLDVLGPALSRRLGFLPFFLSHTGYTKAVSIRGAAPLAGTFPVVLYSHEWGEFRTIALNQVESLASHGYVVIAPDHSYAALASRFSDGEVIVLDLASLPTAGEVDAESQADLSEQLITTLTDDLIGIIDALARGEAGPFGVVATHADLGRIGVFGHGAGGGAAVKLCLVDVRCRGVVGLDPWVEPVEDRVIAVPAAVPMLFMRSDEWRGTNNDGRLRGMAERSNQRTYWLGISGTSHNDFVMAPLFSPVAHRLGMKGPISAARIVPIVDRYLVGFFDHVLLEAGTAAIDRSSYSEVSLEVIG